jgi:hypothetical protein
LTWIKGEAQNRDNKSVAAAIVSARDSRYAASTPRRQCAASLGDIAIHALAMAAEYDTPMLFPFRIGVCLYR